SEDRFRVRDPSPYPDKDYTLDRTRRGLWHSTMAGGVANIWGYLIPEDDEGASRPYPNMPQIRTWATFFENRFLKGMQRIESPHTTARVLADGNSRYIFYQEDTSSISVDLSAMDGPQPGVAVDTCQPYRALDLGTLRPGLHHTF